MSITNGIVPSVNGRFEVLPMTPDERLITNAAGVAGVGGDDISGEDDANHLTAVNCLTLTVLSSPQLANVPHNAKTADTETAARHHRCAAG